MKRLFRVTALRTIPSTAVSAFVVLPTFHKYIVDMLVLWQSPLQPFTSVLVASLLARSLFATDAKGGF